MNTRNKSLNDVMLSVRTIIRTKEEVTYKDIKDMFLMFTTSYTTKKQFIKKYSPTRSFWNFVALREFLAEGGK